MRSSLARIISAVVVATSTVAFVQVAEASATVPAPFDTSFGTNGIASVSIPKEQSPSTAVDIVSTGSGNLLVQYEAWTYSQGPLVTIGKYTSTGTPDTTFGTNGRTTPIALFGSQIALQPTGKILVAGVKTAMGGDLYDIYVHRLNTNGQPDTTFGTDGILKIAGFPGKRFYGYHVKLAVDRTNGRIFLGFMVDSANINNPNLYFVAISADGYIDPNWGRSGGREVIPPTSSTVSAFTSLSSLQVLSDGSLLGVGSTYANQRAVLLTKINPNGYLDLSFDGAGFDFDGGGPNPSIPGNGNVVIKFATQTDAFMTTSYVLPSDDIMIAGIVGDYASSVRYYGVAKILADGTPDTGFGSNGFVVDASQQATSDNPEKLLRRIAKLPDGTFVIPVNNVDGVTSGVIGVTSSGTISSGLACSGCFGSGQNNGAQTTAVEVDGGNRIIITGTKLSNNNSLVKAITASGQPDSSFTNAEIALNFEPWSTYIDSSTPLSDGSIISVGGARLRGESNDIARAAVFKFTSTGVLDSTFGTNGYRLLTPPNPTEPSYSVDSVVQSDGKIVVVWSEEVNAIRSLIIWRLNTDGSLDTSFGPNNSGLVQTSFNANLYINVVGAHVDSGGNLLLPLTTYDNGVATSFIYKYTSSGQLTTTSPVFGPGATEIATTQLMPDGSLYIAGGGTQNGVYHVYVSKLLPNGSMDAIFSGGYVSWPEQTPNRPDWVNRMMIDSESRVILVGTAGENQPKNFIIRLNPNGTFDNSFNGAGWKEYSYKNRLDIEGQSSFDLVKTQAGYTLIGGGDDDPGNDSNWFYGMTRITTDGAVDQSFGNNGVLLSFPEERFQAVTVAALQDGSLLVSGATDKGPTWDAVIYRIRSTSSPTTSSTTTTTAPPPSTTLPPVTAPPTSVPVVNAESDDIKLVVAVSQATVLKRLKWTPAKGSKVTMAIAPSSKKVCRVSKTRVLAIDTGTCRVTVSSTLKGKTTKKTLAFKVS